MTNKVRLNVSKTLILAWEKSSKNAIIFVGKVGRNELSMKDVFMDTAKLMSKGQVTIPKRMRDLLNLENGDYVTFVVNKDRVEIQNSNVLSKKTLRNKGGEMTI